jgi:hypothetical protein
MKIPVSLKGFENRNFCVRPAGLLFGPQLFVDGARVKTCRGRCTLRNNQGQDIQLKIKFNLIDPIPKINAEGDILELAPRLKKLEYIWLGLPVILLFIGGIIGGLCAFWGVYFNFRVFRSRLPVFAKFMITGIITSAVFVAYYLMATKAALILRKYDRKIY